MVSAPLRNKLLAARCVTVVSAPRPAAWFVLADGARFNVYLPSEHQQFADFEQTKYFRR